MNVELASVWGQLIGLKRAGIELVQFCLATCDGITVVGAGA